MWFYVVEWMLVVRNKPVQICKNMLEAVLLLLMIWKQTSNHCVNNVWSIAWVCWIVSHLITHKRPSSSFHCSSTLLLSFYYFLWIQFMEYHRVPAHKVHHNNPDKIYKQFCSFFVSLPFPVNYLFVSEPDIQLFSLKYATERGRRPQRSVPKP